MAAFTEGAGLGNTSPIQAHRAALDSLENGTNSKEDALRQALAKASLDQLKRSLQNQTESLNEGAALRLSQEFTRRGIAPCFRGLPVRNDPWWKTTTDEVNFILLSADLEWLVSRYPNHKTNWRSMRYALSPDQSKREKAISYLLNDGEREAPQIALALGLTDDMQRELAWAQLLNTKRWVDRLHGRLPFAEAAIRDDVDSRPWKSKAPKENTIMRRLALWQCAELGVWKPQRAAEFYKMLTGESMTRQAVSEQLVKLPKVRRSPL